MNEFVNAANLFINTVHNLRKNTISLQSSLEEIVLTSCRNELAYIDDRKDLAKLKLKHGYDFWSGLSKDLLKDKGLLDKLYSASWKFPDFLFKVTKHEEEYTGGSLLELKDSKKGNVASFNSTVPTKTKSLEEVDTINNGNLVSRIAGLIDGKLSTDEEYYKFERRCFYLVRTFKNNSDKVKISIVDGSFFETVPKDHLFYQMFLNVLNEHLEKKQIEISGQILEAAEQALSHITDQSIIASSQSIEGASVRPRLRIMAEVHPEGNPHSNHYPQILKRSFNLILQSSPQVDEVEEYVRAQLPEVEVFSIHHKRNGEHRVFKYGRRTHLARFFC